MIEGGYVHRGGAICMELLTKKGWCSAYTIETIVLQVATTITKVLSKSLFQLSKIYRVTVELASTKIPIRSTPNQLPSEPL